MRSRARLVSWPVPRAEARRRPGFGDHTFVVCVIGTAHLTSTGMLNASQPLADAHPGHTALTPPSNPAVIVLGGALLIAGVLVVSWWLGALAAFQYLYVVLALLLGLILYLTFPVLFVGYALWLWFLTPFLRRVVDFHLGVYQSPSIITYVPHLVSGIAFFTLVRYRRRLFDKDGAPFFLVLTGLAYGYAAGIMINGAVSASYGMLKWIAPVFLGLHIAFTWHHYPAMRRCIQRALLWSVAVMGAYAIVQFYVMPPWDSFWMTHVAWRDGSLGSPRPLLVRPFSTLDSWGSFAMVMMAGLLALFGTTTWKHLFAALPGYAGFFVSASRAAWGGWLMALVLMAVWSKGRMRTRLVGTLVLGMLVVLPLLTVPEIENRVSNRFKTFQNLEEDVSLNARLEQYEEASLHVLTDPVGSGLGFHIYRWDSGLLVLAFQLGWPGLLLFVTGLVLLVRLLWQGWRRTGDPFTTISVAIALAMLVMLIFKNSLPDATGAVFWSFAGIVVAGYRYHSTQESDEDGAEPEVEVEQERP